MSWLETLVQYAQQQITDDAREALWMRGADDDQIDLYRIGCLWGELPALPAGSESEAFLKWSLKGSKLNGVFVLPLTNALGQVKGLQFRHVNREVSGYTDFFAAQDEAVGFGLSQAMPAIWRTQAVWLTEGAFDLFPVQRACPSAIATLTNRVSKQLVNLLRRLVQDVYLVYDMDVRGREGCDRFLKYHGKEFNVVDVKLPRPPMPGQDRSAKDPNEVWEAWGDEKLGAYLRQIGN